MYNDEKTVVDIVAKEDPTGQFMKITDKNSMSFNNRVSSFLHYIQSIEGHNGIFPELGGFNRLNSIPFSENTQLLLSSIANSCSSELGFEVEISYKDDPHKYNYIIVEAVIVGLPGVIQFDMNTKHEMFHVINPRYIKKDG